MKDEKKTLSEILFSNFGYKLLAFALAVVTFVITNL